jgi:hypothetical protein
MARAAVAAAVGAVALGLAPSALATPGAILRVNPLNPDIVKASTFSGNFILENQSSNGELITGFKVDLSDGPSLFYDFAFDPKNDDTPAGDTQFKGFEFKGPDAPGAGDKSSAGVGALNDKAKYSVPEGGGFAVLEHPQVTGLAPGKKLVFAIDIDPTSVQGTLGTPPPHQASVSGAELHGATVTVTFTGGANLTNDIVRNPANDQGADWKGTATLLPGVPGEVALGRAGGAISPASVRTAHQGVVVTGPAGAAGIVLVSEGQLIVAGAPNGGFDLEPFEANMAVRFTEVPFTIGPTGTAVVPVTLTDSPPLLNPEADPVVPFQPKDTGLNYITAYLTNGIGPGPVTDPLVMKLDPNAPVDSDPPAVASLSPEDGATGVATGANVTATFDEAMSPATLAAGFTLADEAGAAVPAAVSGSGTQFTLDPAASLAAGRRYTATIAATAADAAGNPLGAARSWSFTTARETTTNPDGNPPPPNPDDPWCAVVPERPKPSGNGNSKIGLEASQLLISQRIAQAAVRRANAIEAWLAEGLVTDDFCGNAFGAADFGAGVTLAAGTSGAASTPAKPRPIVVPRSRGGSGNASVELDVGQLLINQRISQAAVRRVNALAARLEAGLTGGDIRDGAVSGAKLKRNLVIAAALGGAATPASQTQLGGRGGGGGKVTVSVKQLQINQRISQAAVRRVNQLVDRLMRGLTGEDFRDGTIGAADLTPGLRSGTPGA